MNPALLQHSYPVDYATNSNNKYLGHDRSFANSTALPANDFSLLPRKADNGLTGAPLEQMSTLPTNTGLDYNTQLIQDHPYHSGSQLLLSPPSSIDGTTSNNVHPTSSGFQYQTPGRLLSSNASSTDQYSTANTSFQPPSWADATMTEYNTRLRAPTLPSTLSPPLTYGHPNGISGQYFTPSGRPFDHYGTNFPHGRPYQPAELSQGFNGNKLRAPSYANPSMTSVYNTGCVYSPMPSQTANRPEGPPFEETKKILPLINGLNREIYPELTANIQKGFFQVDGKWTCYRRNYFSVVCGFHFKNSPPDGPVYLQRHSQLEPVHQYAVAISAKTANVSSQDSETRTLVQHTPKRDKATESVPVRHPIQASPIQSLHSNGSMNVNSMYPGTHHISPGMLGSFDGFPPHPHHAVPMSHTFERIQFQRATANNGKRRAQQQYFHVVVELSVQVGRANSDGDWIVVATRQSHPMVVRGRSPGHYKDNRREGPTAMDPDSGNGSVGDGGSGSFSMPPLMGPHSSSMDWSSTPRGHSHQYGHSYASHDQGSDSSSSSMGSAMISNSRSIDTAYQLSRPQARQSMNGFVMNRGGLSPTSEHNHDSSSNRKRPFEDSGSDSDQHYYSTPSVEDNLSPAVYDYAGVGTTRPLCASS